MRSSKRTEKNFVSDEHTLEWCLWKLLRLAVRRLPWSIQEALSDLHFNELDREQKVEAFQNLTTPVRRVVGGTLRRRVEAAVPCGPEQCQLTKY